MREEAGSTPMPHHPGEALAEPASVIQPPSTPDGKQYLN